jgi:hypothetical protein
MATLPLFPVALRPAETAEVPIDLEGFGLSLDNLPNSAHLKVKARLYHPNFPSLDYMGRAYAPNLWAHHDDDFFIYTDEALQSEFCSGDLGRWRHPEPMLTSEPRNPSIRIVAHLSATQ